MKISILTLFPEMMKPYFEESIMKRASEKGLVEIECIDFRAYTENKHTKVDDTPYGGGAGMLLYAQPIIDCLEDIKTKDSHVVLLSPQGSTFTQKQAHTYAKKSHLILICGHYEGFDERIRLFIDEEVSIGDFVLTGGELAAMTVSDAVVRLLKDVIVQESYEMDSFENGLLEYPQYTKPSNFRGMEVPEVLLSGHHENIRKWRLYESLKKTYRVRRDLLENREFTKEEQAMLDDIMQHEEK